jgi:S1-C subfamily serine protease/Tfp pilus assembly protein PilF
MNSGRLTATLSHDSGRRRPLTRFRILMILAGLAVHLSFTHTPARAGSGAVNVYQQTLHGTVLVFCKSSPTNVSQGTAFLVDRENKLLITAWHVVGNVETVSAYFPSFKNGRVIAERSYYQKELRPIEGKVILADAKRDLAVIELKSIPPEAAPLKLAAESPLPADLVHAVGNPGGTPALWTYTSGTVRQVYHGKWKENMGRTVNEVEANIVESQLPINHGDSGGPLVNSQGEAIGVNVLIGNSVQLISVSIDVSEVKQILRDANILLHPKNASDYFSRGLHFVNKQRPDQGIVDFAEAIRLDPKHSQAHYSRGLAFLSRGETERAIADFTESVRLDPKNALAYYQRGSAFEKKREKDKAVADFAKAIELDRKFAPAHLRLSWSWVTSPTASSRDGKKALDHALKACNLSAWKDAACFDALAAAYAECGQFEDAVMVQQRSLELASAGQKADFESHLKLYLAGKPVRAMQ